MMKTKQEPYWKHVLKRLCYRIIDKIDNNANANFKKNGEYAFLNDFLKNNTGKKLTIFDIGSNHGDWSKLVLDLAQSYKIDVTLHLFEPTKKSHQKLLKRFDGLKNVKINHCGLSDKNEKATIHYDKEGSSLASLYERDLAKENRSLSLKEDVSLIPGCQYIQNNEIANIDLLKMDVEGHELSVLKGFDKYLTKELIPTIQFEYGGCNLDSKVLLKELYETLEDREYHLYKIMPDYLEERNYSKSMENFKYANYVALS